MKDTILTARRKKTELLTLLVCFVIANLLNLYSIIAYHTPYKELITSIFYVTIFAAALYILWTVIRIACYALKRVFAKKTTTHTGTSFKQKS